MHWGIRAAEVTDGARNGVTPGVTARRGASLAGNLGSAPASAAPAPAWVATGKTAALHPAQVGQFGPKRS